MKLSYLKNKFFFAFLLFSLLLLPSYSYASDEYKTLASKTATAQKQWTISFSDDVDSTTVTQEKIYIKDSKGEKLSLPSIEVDGEKVYINPPLNGYKPGEYTIYIEKGVKSLKNIDLKEAVKMDFTISEPFSVSSFAFIDGGDIPTRCANIGVTDGQNRNIPISWSSKPEGTKSYAILMYDLHPIAENWVHWAVTNIPYYTNDIYEGVSASNANSMPSGSTELYNTFGTLGYGGPEPPIGSGKHEYKIIVYALNVKTLDISDDITKENFEAAVSGKVIEKAEISGYYSR